MTLGGEPEPAPGTPATTRDPQGPAVAGDRPPFLPPGWHTVPTAPGDGTLVLSQRPVRRRVAAAGLGVGAAALWAWTGALAAGDTLRGDKPWIWLMGLLSAGATYAAVRRLRFAETWRLSPGRLHIGEARVRSGRWHGYVSEAAALEVTVHEADGSRHHRLSAVMAGGRRQTMFDGSCDDGSVQALGSWLAVQADIPFTDHTR
jgi:hypothetical protein